MDEVSLILKLVELGLSGVFIAILLRMVVVLYRENRDLFERVVKLENTYARKMQRTNELLNRLVASIAERIPEPNKRPPLVAPAAPKVNLLSSEHDEEEGTPDLPAHLGPSVSPEPIILTPVPMDSRPTVPAAPDEPDTARSTS